MELRTLRHIVVLAQELNFTKASDKLNMTQSALSRSVREFEDRCKVRLFDRARGGGGVTVTSIGHTVVAAAASMLTQEKELYTLLERNGRGESGHVSFGVGRLPGRSILPTILAKVLSDRPGLIVNAAVDQFKPLLTLLNDQQIEFFVCGPGPEAETEALEQSPLGNHPFGLAFFVRPEHPLLSLPKNSKKVVIGKGKYPLATSITTFDFAIPASLRDHIESTPRIRSSDIGALSIVAHSSDAILLSSSAATQAEVKAANLVELRPKPKGSLSFPMVLYSLRGRTISPAANWIISLLRLELGRIGGL